jgi:chaperonin GroES
VKGPGKPGKKSAGGKKDAARVSAPRGKAPEKAPARGESKPSAAPAPSPERGPAKPSGAGVKQGMANVRPLRDRVLVKRLEEEEQKVGGIIVPDTAKEKPQQAEVIAVGSGRVLENGQREPLAVKAGDKVLVGKWSGTDVRIDGTDYLILKEDEILGILG